MQPKIAKAAYIRPIDLLNEAQSKNVPGFARIETQCCYHCRWLTTNMMRWFCGKHDLTFGYVSGENATSIQAEFVCDDWEAVRSVDDE